MGRSAGSRAAVTKALPVGCPQYPPRSGVNFGDGVLPMTSAKQSGSRMRVAVNLIQDDPNNPSGKHWCWVQTIPEMAKQLAPGEELHLVVSQKMRKFFQVPE